MSRAERGGRINEPTEPTANSGQVDPTKANETEQRKRLVEAFWAIYNKNQDEGYRQVLRRRIYGILFTLMYNPGVEFVVNQEEGNVYFSTNSMLYKPNQAVGLVPVDTNEGFEEKLRADQENLEMEKQKLLNEQRLYGLAENKILPTVQDFPDGSDVKTSFLQTFNNLNRRLQAKLESLKTQEQGIEKAKLAKEIGDSLLEQIKQGNST